MNWSYAYNPYLWPAMISAVLIAALGWYSWRRRNMPGALPLAVAAIFGVLWIIGSILEISAEEPSAKIFWFSFQGIWKLPLATAMTFFILQYAGLGRWLTRRNLILLSMPTLLVTVIILTNGFHHSMWQEFQVGQTVQPIRGNTYWVGFGYTIALTLTEIIVLIWFFIRSPQHRWPVTLMLIGQVGGRAFYVLDIVKISFLDPLGPIFSMFIFVFLIYAIALFRFHVFNPVPLARAAVLEQMQDGMLVLDMRGCIVSLNPMAEKMLGKPGASLRGREIVEVLPAGQPIPAHPDRAAAMQSEVSLRTGNIVKHYNMNLTPLTDRRGEVLGQLLLLHDITEQKQAQARILEQQDVVATLRERERLARELHDGIGQVLGYVGMQTQAARKWVLDGNSEKAEAVLGRLAEVARDAHADVRESILNLRTDSSPEWSFVPALKQYLDNFQVNYGIRTELSFSDKIEENTFSPAAGVQLLRVVQETLTNARKHSGARTVRVAMEKDKSGTHITITDDGCGFDTGQFDRDNGSHFGLAFMRERMEQIGGSLGIYSRPGAGTTVRLDVPLWNRLEELE